MEITSAIARGLFAAWSWLPSSVQQFVLAMALDDGPTGPLPAYDRPLSHSKRLLILPTNSAGQAASWAAAVEEFTSASGANFALTRSRDFGYGSTYSASRARSYGSKKWQHEFFSWAQKEFTHVVVESCSTVSGPPSSRRVLREIREMQQRGLQVALLFHGSDIREVGKHARREHNSPFQDQNSVLSKSLRSVVRRNRAVLNQVPTIPTFVSTPDLLIDLPEAELVPVIPESRYLKTADGTDATTPVTDRVPRVVHIPSRSSLKGTEGIRDNLLALNEKRIIEYKELSGLSRDEVWNEIDRADIVLDQFTLGSYGVAAVEAMALGKIVVSHVSKQVRREIKSRFSVELPIIESAQEDVGKVVDQIARRWLDNDAQSADKIKYDRAGRKFVRTVHSGRQSAEAFATFLQTNGTQEMKH